MRKLTDAQVNALAVISDGAIDDFEALIFIGRQRARVLATLEDRGLARWYPYGGARGKGCWRITPAGRKTVTALVKEGRLTEERPEEKPVCTAAGTAAT